MSAESFSLSDRFPEVRDITLGPKALADKLRARGLSGDAELAELFDDFYAILPVTLARIKAANEAMEGRML